MTTDHFSSRAPGAAQPECGEPGSILLCMGLFSRFYVPALRCTAHSVSKTRVNALMGRCAASGIRDRWCFALTANRFNSNPSCFSAAAAAARMSACPRGSHERAAACRRCRSPSAERRTVSVRPARRAGDKATSIRRFSPCGRRAPDTGSTVRCLARIRQGGLKIMDKGLVNLCTGDRNKCLG